MKNEIKAPGQRKALLRGATLLAAAAAGFAATPAFAQESAEEETIVVTGTRIQRQDYVSVSPIATVSQEQVVGNADVTLETYLNTLPQIVAGGTTTSNNPPNGGQANIDLRGLGANRNLILVDGRRPMVGANDLTVDLNTIPAALIENIEVITGGAGAVYGADAVAGVINLRLRNNFEGVDLRTSYQNSTEYWDAKEWTAQMVVGGNFADGAGNAVFGFDHTEREALIKAQRPFAQNASSTTGTPPEGTVRWGSTNPIPQAAVDALFATAPYGSNAPGSAEAISGRLGFNSNGTLFGVGSFNTPIDMVNYQSDPSFPNPNFAPDFYSYNFDPINLLQLPLNRDSFMTNIRYELDNGVGFFANASWTQYRAATALAPTPVGGVTFGAPGEVDPASEVSSSLIESGQSFFGNIPVPISNDYIPADLQTLLAARVGDDPRLVGSGAGEAFLFGFRSVGAGLRQENFTNTVVNFVAGVNGPVGNSGWDFEVYVTEGRTETVDRQQGNINTQTVTDLLALGSGSAALCDGGFNPFGYDPANISEDCWDLVREDTVTNLTMRQRVGQGFVRGPLGDFGGGEIEGVFGVEYRAFDYEFDPGSAALPLSGFGTSDPEAGNNEFLDFFGELGIPFGEAVNVSLGYRNSTSQFTDDLTGTSNDRSSNSSYSAAITWDVMESVLLRASYARAVRAPNFAELFAGGSSFPQVFNPCSTTSDLRGGPDAAAVSAMCNAINGAPLSPTFVDIPGTQAGIDTEGNADLEPESADTITVGATFNLPGRWRASVDYYSIEVNDAILVPDPNVAIADCFNYLGSNPTYDPNYGYCQSVSVGGLANSSIEDIVNGTAAFSGENGGHIQTSGIDFQADWSADIGPGMLSLNGILSYLIEYQLEDTPLAPEIDYAGTINYFGGGISLGQTLPEWRGTLNANYDIGDWGLIGRVRYIHEMENRGSRQYVGESSFEGVDAQWYLDLAGDWDVTENLNIRLGVNNVTDEDPQVYRPNVQSGTDPATYDIIGRRVYATLRARF